MRILLVILASFFVNSIFAQSQRIDLRPERSNSSELRRKMEKKRSAMRRALMIELHFLMPFKIKVMAMTFSVKHHGLQIPIRGVCGIQIRCMRSIENLVQSVI